MKATKSRARAKGKRKREGNLLKVLDTRESNERTGREREKVKYPVEDRRERGEERVAEGGWLGLQGICITKRAINKVLRVWRPTTKEHFVLSTWLLQPSTFLPSTLEFVGVESRFAREREG